MIPYHSVTYEALLTDDLITSNLTIITHGVLWAITSCSPIKKVAWGALTLHGESLTVMRLLRLPPRFRAGSGTRRGIGV